MGQQGIGKTLLRPHRLFSHPLLPLRPLHLLPQIRRPFNRRSAAWNNPGMIPLRISPHFVREKTRRAGGPWPHLAQVF
jgi:hypothetical protein